MVAGAVAVSGAVAAVAVSAAVLPVPSASAAPPDFLTTLAGPSRAAMYPSGLEYDEANNRLVVADTGRDRILFYSLTGDPLGGFGEYGDGDGQFASPRDVAVDPQGNIYVADAENNRIQKFDERRRLHRLVGWTGQRQRDPQHADRRHVGPVQRRAPLRLHRTVPDPRVGRQRRLQVEVADR